MASHFQFSRFRLMFVSILVPTMKTFVLSTAFASDGGTTEGLKCSDNFIPVPAHPPYTFQPFCVAKYEMKLQYDGAIVEDGNDSNNALYDYDTHYSDRAKRDKFVPVSVPKGQPWVNIRRGENGSSSGKGAIEACRSLGPGYDLISNAQWQALAQNAELDPSNWTSNAVGVEMMVRGHSDGEPLQALSVTDTTDGYDQTGNSQSYGKDQRRTLTLSNGEVIWDLSANVSEWTKDNNVTDFESSDYWSQITDSSHATKGTVGDLMGTAKFLFGPVGAYSKLGRASEFGGLGYGYLGGAAGAVFRGGIWSNVADAGVFGVGLGIDPSVQYDVVGFRCAFQNVKRRIKRRGTR